MQNLQLYYYFTNAIMLVLGIIAFLILIKKKITDVFLICMILLAIESIIAFTQKFNTLFVNLCLEYLFYALSISWLLHSTNFSAKVKRVLLIISTINIGISLISVKFNAVLNYEIPLSLNYIILIIILIFQSITVTKSYISGLKFYLILFAFFTYNIISGLLYSLKNIKYLNSVIYMKANFWALWISMICWGIALFIKDSEKLHINE